MNSVESLIRNGNDYPFDESDGWWKQTECTEPPSKPTDWAHSAARGIVKRFQEVNEISEKFNLEKISEHDRKLIVENIAEIIRVSFDSKESSLSSISKEQKMAQEIYGASINEAFNSLRKNVYHQVGKLLALQSKGATIPPNITVKDFNIPLKPNF